MSIQDEFAEYLETQIKRLEYDLEEAKSSLKYWNDHRVTQPRTRET